MELSIDTSTGYASVALSDGGALVCQRTWRAGRNHSVELTPTIRRLMRDASVATSDLSAVFVARGPGGFTSLRVGIATAKGLSMGLGLPLVGVGTLAIEMEPHLPSGLPLCAVIPAGGDRLYAGWSDREADTLTVLTATELAECTDRQTLFCGEGAAGAADVLRQHAGDLVGFAGGEPPTRSAGTLARIAFGSLREGRTETPETLEPLYMGSAQQAVASRTHLG